jgi:hypothetical protein
MLPSNPDKVETDVFMNIMGDEEFDRTIDAMKDAEQQVLLNIAKTLVEQMDSKTAGSLGGLCLVRLDELDRMYPEVLPEYDTEERVGRPGGRTYDRQCEAETLQAQWEAKVCAAVDMMIETVTEGNESDENGQCGLWDAAQLIVPHLDSLTCSEIGDQCRRRERELSDPTPEGTVVDRENYGEDIPVEEPETDYTPSLEELQGAADARGEPGPLDKEPKAYVIGADRMNADDWNEAGLWYDHCTMIDKVQKLIDDMVEFFFDEPEESKAFFAQLDEVGCEFLYSEIREAFLKYVDWTEDDLPGGGYSGKERRIKESMVRDGAYVKEDWEKPTAKVDVDYFEIAKSIRHKAILFNMAVLEAHQHYGIITKTEPAKEEGCIMVKDIKLGLVL